MLDQIGCHAQARISMRVCQESGERRLQEMMGEPCCKRRTMRRLEFGSRTSPWTRLWAWVLGDRFVR